MIKKLATTLPNFVHTILAKLNKDDPRGEERGAPANASSSSSSKPIPSAKQAKNPFFLSRDYLDHTLDAISAKTGMTIPPHLYHALMNCLLTNNHLVIDSSFIESGAHATGFALFNMLPYLVGLRCSYVMCTSSTTPNEIFRKLVDPHSQSYSVASTDSDMELNASSVIPLSLSLTTTPMSVPVKTAPRAPDTSALRPPNTTRHQRRQSRLRHSETLSEEAVQLALNPNITGSQTSLPQHPSGKQGPIYAQVLVVDNLMTAPPSTLAALYQVMKTRQVPLKGYKYNTPSVFIVIAVSGKKRFPAISPSPFLMNIPFFEPLIASHTGESPSLAFTEGEILQARAAVPSTYVAQDMHQYMRNIVMALRNHSAVDIGPDTLAVSAFESAARAAAVIAGQKFVTPTHILAVVSQVLNHRASLVPINPSSTNPLTFPLSAIPVHATSRFMAYVHTGRDRNKNKNKNPANSPRTSTTTTTTTTTNQANPLVNSTSLTNSTNLTNPTNPSRPTSPTNPTVPITPTYPTNSSRPISPTNLLNPANPTNPPGHSRPTSPTNLTVPITPTYNPSRPTSPTNLTNPQNLTVITNFTNATNSTNPTPTNSSRPISPTNLTNSTRPISPTNLPTPTNSLTPTNPTNPTNRITPTNLINPINPPNFINTTNSTTPSLLVSPASNPNLNSNSNSNANSNSNPNPNSNSNISNTTNTNMTQSNSNSNISVNNPNNNNNSPTQQTLSSEKSGEITFYIPNFPTPPSAELFLDSFELIEYLMNNLDIPV